MKTDLLSQVRAICQQAMEQAPADRPRFLREACAGNESLRRAVESLMTSDETVAEMPSPGYTTQPAPGERLTAERWQRIEQLFEAALELDAAARDKFLAAACAGDASLRREVESLIACENAAQGFVANAVADAARSLKRDDALPSRIGAYKVIRELGRGGMGAVYLAVRDDDEYKKRVAIKLIRRGMDTEDILRRFRNERQILASLDHPHIARLLDGGTTTDGLPYFVMEYIEGYPVSDYCDAHRLSTVERLKLFRTICSAVHYAHQNLVVHRDLKPSNIIVTADGTVKLLDFGIAKVLNPEMSGQPINPTLTAVRLMTPEYASPEQVRGQSVTTASDVYSLGVLLYELLTGHRPYQMTSRAPHEIMRVVCESEPTRPSTIIAQTRRVVAHDGSEVVLKPETLSRKRETEPGKLRRELTGDLDNIVLMALRKEPQRRYGSVEQLSEDIRRHLEGLPVIAREDTFKYRAGKFVRRNKAAVTAAVLFAALLLIFLGTTLVQARRIARERDRAERERVKAEQVSGFLVNLFRVNDPGAARGSQVTAREILDQGADKIRAELKDQPETQATLLHTIGQVYYSLGLYERSAALLEDALQQRRAILGNEHPEVARTLTSLVQVIFELGQRERAEALTREALAIRRRAYGNEHPDVAESLNDLAMLTRLRGDSATAEPLYRETIAIQRKLLGNDSPALATTLHNLAILLMDKKDYAGAEATQREVLAMRRRAMGDDAPDVAMTLHNLASILRRRGDYAGAEATLREVLSIRRKLHPDGHPDTALTLHNLGTLKRDQHDYAQAESFLRECLAMRRKTLPADHSFIGRAHIELGRVLVAQKSYAAAQAELTEGLRIAQKTADQTYIPHALDGLGDLRFAQRRFAEAESDFLKSCEQYQSLRDTERAQAVRGKLAALYEAWGRPDQARALTAK